MSGEFFCVLVERDNDLGAIFYLFFDICRRKLLEGTRKFFAIFFCFDICHWFLPELVVLRKKILHTMFANHCK